MLFNAKAATGVSTPQNVAGCDQVLVCVSAAVNSSLTFKFQGSGGASITSEEAPDFSAAQAVTNQWDYVAVYDLQSPGTVIAGDTGVTIDNASVAANTTMYLVNIPPTVRWFSLQVSAYTDGSLTAYMVTCN
jgi:hypothetical protein